MKRLLSSLLGLAVMAVVVLFPFAVAAQEAAAKLAGTELGKNISGGAELGLTIYEMLIPIIVAALGWVSIKISSFIKAKTKNEMVAGMLVRLNDSVFGAVRAVNEQMKDLIGKAKDPASPGGVKITKEEADKLKAAALDYVKSYWGEKGLKELASVLGFGGFFGIGKDTPGLEKMIANKIESAVNEVKSEAKNPK